MVKVIGLFSMLNDKLCFGEGTLYIYPVLNGTGLYGIDSGLYYMPIIFVSKE